MSRRKCNNTFFVSTPKIIAFSLAGKTRCAFDCDTPNGECATKGEDRRKWQKAQLRAMRITLRAAKTKRTSTMIYVSDLFANKLDEVLYKLR